MSITPGTQSWIERWDRQQARYMADRELRFQVMFDALAEIAGAEGPLTVVDLGSGPGSLSVRLLDRFPGATVLAVDVDPLLLEIGRAAHGARSGLRFVTADLRDPAWTDRLGEAGPVDGVLSTTALHWLGDDDLTRLYRDLAGLIRPGGAFLDGDHRRFAPDEAVLERAAKGLVTHHRERAGRDEEGVDTWTGWWEAVRADPELAAAAAERDRLGHAHPHGRHGLLDADHLRLLRAAGFAEAGILWQHGDERILAAVR